MTWHASRPYNDLPPLPPTCDLETRAVLKAAIGARTALATLNQAARQITNPAVLVNTIPILEAQASSEIENIVTTADDLFAFAYDEQATNNPAIKETLHYRAALITGIDLIRKRPLSVNTAISICEMVKSRQMGIRTLPGTYIRGSLSSEPIYTPPEGEGIIRRKLDNWASFLHDIARGIDPLIVMAAAHYQFEAIHPFADGNGRTGRIINILMLIQFGILDEPILYLSRYIIARKDEYYRLLLKVTQEAAWEEWILFMLEGVRQTASSTNAKITEIIDLQSQVLDRIREVTGSGANADLLSVLFEQPYCRIANVVERCGVSRPTATKWLTALKEDGVLKDLRVGRERLFINHEFLTVLTRVDVKSSS